MQYQDHRQTDTELNLSDLSKSEQDEFEALSLYLMRSRVCSNCGEYFCLRYTLAKPSVCRMERDHIDYATEAYTFLQEFGIPYRIYLVMKCKGLLPMCKESSGRTVVVYHKETLQPITVQYHRC